MLDVALSSVANIDYEICSAFSGAAIMATTEVDTHTLIGAFTAVLF
jgi:hypothetical protein